MFTSRSEYRMSCRADNADLRLTAKGRKAGVVGEMRWKHFKDSFAKMQELKTLLERTVHPSTWWRSKGFLTHTDTAHRSAFDMLRSRGTNVDSVLPYTLGDAPTKHPHNEFDGVTKSRIAIEAMYMPYIARQAKNAETFLRDEHLTLPMDLDYDAVHGLSMGEKEALRLVRPVSVGMARRVEGVTPAGALRLLKYTRRRNREVAAESIALGCEAEKQGPEHLGSGANV